MYITITKLRYQDEILPGVIATWWENWSGIHAGALVPKVEVGGKAVGAATLGKAPCKGKTEGNYMSSNNIG